MSRRFLFTTTLSLTLAAPFSAPLCTPTWAAPEETPPAIDNAKLSAIGRINADNVYVRSGAGDNYYPATKLIQGAEVTVVGEKFDWLKIVPPQGSFSYIAKAFVDKTDADSGTVNRDDANVRAGSELNTLKTTVQSQLASGQKVRILGEVDEYYKIEPPVDAFVYVNKQYVDFVKAIPSVAAGQQQTQTPGAAPAGPQDQTAVTETPTAPVDGAKADKPVAVADKTPTTKPSSAEADFEKLEADFTTASAQVIEKQPLNELLAGYQKVTSGDALPLSMKRIADYRVQTLKARIDARDQFLAVQKNQAEGQAKLKAAKAEQEEIAQQIKEKDVKVYTAVGTLRTSSLQQGAQMTYRLTDPASGRTVCYLRSDDPKIGTALGQFIGVKGEVTSDPTLNLKVVMPTEWAQVDPNQVFRGVGAQIVPPSLLPQAAPPAQQQAQQASASEK